VTQSKHNGSAISSTTPRFTGTSFLRKEDHALLTGAGRYADDIPVSPLTLSAYIIRSPHAHAQIKSIDASAALEMDGVVAVITGKEIAALSDSFLVAVKEPVPQWSLALDWVRYVGEPVAVVVAVNRYVAEDAAEHVGIDYVMHQAVVDPRRAILDDAVVVHQSVGKNEISARHFSYGDPTAAFAKAHRTFRLEVDFPRHSYTPMECFVVVAEYKAADQSYDVLSNFQGPFSAHPVMARALRVASSKLRLRTPADSGGSFGVKLSVFPYIVLMSLVSKCVGRPVKWVEDRLEHLLAASTGPNRITTIEAAVEADGKITALRLNQLEDYGAYLRAPMPGPLYRMHGALTGAYDIRNLDVTNRIVLTNKAPAALNRGFGGPQIYLTLERMVQHIACELGLDYLDVIKRNLIPASAFPYHTAAGALYDSGDYAQAISLASADGRLDDLRARQKRARAEGKIYGIGFACVVEPGMSNMGYLSTIIPADVREKMGPKNGAVSIATVNVDPLGAVSVSADTPAQGQGHMTIISQIVADALGLTPDDISVNLEIDTQKDQWSIASGNYSCRFSPGTAVAVHLAALKIQEKVKGIAAHLFKCDVSDVILQNGNCVRKSAPQIKMPFGRVAGTAHWSPIMLPEGMEPGLRETAVWSPPELAPPNEADQINTSLTYGFIFDMCGIEIDPISYKVRVDRYVSMHDAGRLLNPLIAEGQIHGAFVQGLATALFEEFVYDEDGSFLTGSFVDYPPPTASEVPDLEIIHMCSPSPFTPLGAKGLGEGNCMSVPACIANAIADALDVRDIHLPATPLRIYELMKKARHKNGADAKGVHA
jgi:2-furoyl-CoA dehydrogenase large subunit